MNLEMPRIRALITDLGGVLVRFDHGITSRALASMSGRPEPEVRHLLYGTDHGYDEGRISSQEFHTWTTRHLGVSIPFERFREIWSDIFFPNPGVENLLGVFKGRYPIVLLSNTNEMHFQHLVERFDVLGLPDRFILSYRIGCSKPDPRIYQAAIEAAGHSGDVCVYIDDIPDYVQAASRQGMHGIVFRTAEELQMDLAALGLSFE